MNPYIEIQALHKSYQDGAASHTNHVLNGVNLSLTAGRKIAIMGPSGSGKTTLLNLLAGFDKPDQGKIMVGGRLLSAMTANDVTAYRNKTIGFVFQFHQLLPQCTILENVLLPTIPYHRDKKAAKQRAHELLRFMGIEALSNKKPAEVSGGECQRTAIARALINQPELLLADEPTGSLDAENARLILDLLVGINTAMGLTLIVATHAMAIAGKMDNIYIMKSGILEANEQEQPKSMTP